MKNFLVSVLCALIATPSPASVVPPRGERPLRLGVVRFEEEAIRKNSGNSVAGERRLGRWLENLDQLSIQTETLPPVHREEADENEGQGNCENLQSLLQSCQRSLALAEEGAGLGAGCSQLQARAEENARQGICGPEVQKSWILESAIAGRQGEWAKQRQLVRKAVSLHPHGFLASPFEWEKEPRGFDAAQFWGTVKAIKEELVRDCRVDIKQSEIYDSIYVNGFVMEPTSRLQLHRHGRWLVRAKKGDQVFRGLASCHAPQALRQGLDLQREDRQFTLRSRLAEVANHRNLDSLLVVQPVHEQIRLFLFQSQDARLLEIPLEKPISIKEWERQQADASLPISPEKLVALLNGGSRIALDAGVSNPAATLDTRLGGENGRWYNSSTFWWVTAGVAAGVATIFLITQNGTVRPNPSIRVELP